MKFLKRHILAIGCLIFFSQPFLLQAQNPVHKILDNIIGLPSNSVYNLLQDANGFIWLSHDKGLSRYDGKQILSYNTSSLQSKSLTNLLPINNAIWCQDFTGSFYFTNTQNHELKNAPFSTPGVFSVAGVIANKYIVSIKYDSLRQFNLQSKQYKAIVADSVQHTGTFFTNEAAYFIQKNIVQKYDGNSLTPLLSIPKTNASFSFLLQANNQFYGITKNTYPYIHQISNRGIKPLHFLPKGLFIQDVNIVGNEIWISTSTGAYCFTKNFLPKYNGQCFFKQHSVTKILKDREHNYWFGTLNKGVLIVPNINSIMYEFNGNGFTTIALANNNILLGTNANSIVEFSYEQKKFTPIFQQSNNHEVLNITYSKQQAISLIASNTLSVLQNNKLVNTFGLAGKSSTYIANNLYAVAYASGICLVNPKQFITAMQIPKWLQTNTGIYEKNIYKLNNGSGRCRSVYYHQLSQTLYVATANGLFYFNKEGNGVITDNNKPIYASQIEAIGNTVYVATFKQGVFSIEKNKVVQSLTLYKNAIYKLHAANNNLWLITDDGLLKHNLASNTTTAFTTANGLPKAELKDVLVHNNWVYIATSVGLVCFEDKQNIINTVAPLLHLNATTVNGKTYSLHKAILPFDSSNIALYFSALSFKASDAVLVQYSINNGTWQPVENNSSSISLPSLSPGKYSIAIRVRNEDGIMVKQPIIINFTINAPFYKQWWFVACIVLTACLLVYIYFKRRLKNQQQQNELLSEKIMLEQELQHSMLASIKSQMNPHFLFNALNTIQSYIYTNEKENASEYLGKFSELTRLILEMSNKTAVSVATEIKALQLYLELEKQRFEDKLQCTFIVDDSISTETTFIPAMLVQPYVENAIKHGLLHSKNNWQLHIQFKKQQQIIQVIIDDNGIGRKRSAELNMQRSRKHQSFSTIANKKRLDILNKGLSTQIAVDIIDNHDAQQQPIGTTIVLNIPMQSH